MDFHYVAASEAGPGRVENEDAFRIVEQARLALLADGMGSQPQGALASRTAIDAVAFLYGRPRWPGVADWQISPSLAAARLRAGFELAHAFIRDEQEPHPFLRMGTSLTALQLLERHVLIVHVGDSRCYRLREEHLEQLTQDHLLIEQHRHLITPEEASDLRSLQHVLSQAVGRSAKLDLHIVLEELRPDDAFLLCTNGMSDFVPQASIEEILRGAGDLELACQGLLAAARRAGSHDDASAIVLRPLQGERTPREVSC